MTNKCTFIKEGFNIMEKYFAKNLKNYRKYKHITQEKLAELIDLDVRQIARLEAGESLPSIPTLIKLCKVFDITPNDIIWQDKNVKNTPLKTDINDILNLAKPEQLELIKKLILAVI